VATDAASLRADLERFADGVPRGGEPAALEAFRALKDAIAAAVPDLEIVVVSRPGKAECLPNLTIAVGRMTYHGDQPEEVFRPSAEQTVYNVGAHEGFVQLRLTATDWSSRAELEEKIRDVFFSDPDMPGLLRTPVTSCPQLGPQQACWETEEDQWDDARAFDRRFESILLVNAIIPALAMEQAPTIESLRLAYTTDIDADVTAATAVPPAVELLQINSDGSISAVT